MCGSTCSRFIARRSGRRGKIATIEEFAVQNISIQKASNLPPAVKSAVEQLLGRPIEADEEVSIVAAPRRQFPFSESRAQVATELENFLNRRAEKTKAVSDEEIDAAIDETVNHVRHCRG